MARIARVVLPDVPHHVTPRGNCRRPLFFSDEDSAHYCQWLRDGLGRADVACLAWCLMDNHVHLILVPSTPESLRMAQADAHRLRLLPA